MCIRCNIKILLKLRTLIIPSRGGPLCMASTTWWVPCPPIRTVFCFCKQQASQATHLLAPCMCPLARSCCFRFICYLLVTYLLEEYDDNSNHLLVHNCQHQLSEKRRGNGRLFDCTHKQMIHVVHWIIRYLLVKLTWCIYIIINTDNYETYMETEI